MGSQRWAHDDPAWVLVLRRYSFAGERIPLPVNVDATCVEVDFVFVQPEDLAGAHRRLALAEDDALYHQAIVAGAADAGALAQPRVLLVGDDLEVVAVHSTLFLARSGPRKLVVLDQFAILGVAEELSDRLLHVRTLGQNPGQRLIAREAVDWPLPELAQERLEAFSQALHGFGVRPVAFWQRCHPARPF